MENYRERGRPTFDTPRDPYYDTFLPRSLVHPVHGSDTRGHLNVSPLDPTDSHLEKRERDKISRSSGLTIESRFRHLLRTFQVLY